MAVFSDRKKATPKQETAVPPPPDPVAVFLADLASRFAQFRELAQQLAALQVPRLEAAESAASLQELRRWLTCPDGPDGAIGFAAERLMAGLPDLVRSGVTSRLQLLAHDAETAAARLALAGSPQLISRSDAALARCFVPLGLPDNVGGYHCTGITLGRVPQGHPARGPLEAIAARVGIRRAGHGGEALALGPNGQAWWPMSGVEGWTTDWDARVRRHLDEGARRAELLQQAELNRRSQEERRLEALEEEVARLKAAQQRQQTEGVAQ